MAGSGIARTPESDVRRGLERARDLPGDTTPSAAARTLSNGSRVTCQGTVPFCLWIAGNHLRDWEEAFWQALSVFGDRDTTCAIVGGIVAGSVGVEGIPMRRRESREQLPEWEW